MVNKYTLKKILSLGSVLVIVFAFTYLISAFAQKSVKPSAHLDRHKKVRTAALTALKLVGDNLLQLGKPIVIRINNRANDETVVTFARTVSYINSTSGREPTEDIVRATFKNNSISIAPTSFFEHNKRLDGISSNLVQVARIAVSSILKRGDINEFELTVDDELAMDDEDSAYRVTIAPIPYIPDNYILLDVTIKGGKLTLTKPAKFP